MQVYKKVCSQMMQVVFGTFFVIVSVFGSEKQNGDMEHQERAHALRLSQKRTSIQKKTPIRRQPQQNRNSIRRGAVSTNRRRPVTTSTYKPVNRKIPVQNSRQKTNLQGNRVTTLMSPQQIVYNNAKVNSVKGKYEHTMVEIIKNEEKYINTLQNILDKWPLDKSSSIGAVCTFNFYEDVMVKPMAKFDIQSFTLRELDLLKDHLANRKKAFDLWSEIDKKEREKPITNVERLRILEGIKTIDPSLYNAIVAVDPTGEKHIVRDHEGGTSVAPSIYDGLPKFFIGSEVIDVPRNELLFTIAHEMAHYALEHFFEVYQVSHREFAEEVTPQEFKKGKRVVGQLPFKETFKKTRQRLKENECDRMAVTHFGVNLDDAIARAKRGAREAAEYDLMFPQKETFHRTHSLWIDRAKYLESLRNEVAFYKERKVKHKQINWEKLAQEYVQKYK